MSRYEARKVVGIVPDHTEPIVARKEERDITGYGIECDEIGTD